MYVIIQKWYDRIKPYLFQYKNGFFVLPYLNNTPQLMWESLKKMPFIKFDSTLGMAESNTPFMNAQLYYQELEKELVLFYTIINYKKNVHYNHYLKSGIPVEYYCLTGFLSKPDENQIKTIINDVHFEGQLWLLHKPGATIRDYHFKDSQTENINIYFTERWLHQYMELFPEGNDMLKQFIASDNGTISFADKFNETGMELLQTAHTSVKTKVSETRKGFLLQHVYTVMAFFKEHCLNETANAKVIALNHADRLKLIEVEQLLNQHLHQKFPGIGFIAQEVGFSETKLKAMFKDVHGTTILDYFQNLQMNAAKDILLQNKMKVSAVASMFGYENASKFAATFKSKTNQLPSEIQKTEIQ